MRFTQDTKGHDDVRSTELVKFAEQFFIHLVDEENSDQVESVWSTTSTCFTSSVSWVEVHSAISRKSRSRELSPREATHTAAWAGCPRRRALRFSHGSPRCAARPGRGRLLRFRSGIVDRCRAGIARRAIVGETSRSYAVTHPVSVAAEDRAARASIAARRCDPVRRTAHREIPWSVRPSDRLR